MVSMVPSYGPYGLGSGSFGSFNQPMFQSSSYPSGTYGLRPGSYGYGTSYGLPGSYGSSVSNDYLESSGSPGSYGSSGSLGSYGVLGSLGSYGSSGSLGSYGSAAIPTSYSSSIPCHNGINIAQQIIHKPVVTELQEVIHKPIISELQEIVNKPVISEIQQVIHKPLFTEHIGFGPTYHGYQKHIVKQPVYQKPTKHFVHQPMAQGGTINLADEYEHAINNPQHIYGPETSSSCGYSGTSCIQQNSQYGPAVPMPSVASYEPVYSSGITNEVSTNFASSVQSSTPCRYATNPSAQTSYRYVAPAPIGYPTQTLLPSNGYVTVPSSESYEQRSSILSPANEEPNRNLEEKLQPKGAEQIMYDEIVPYKLQSNVNQQYHINPIQQQPFESQMMERNSIEDIKNIKMNVEAIAKQIEKNPELRKELLKIITEHTYVDEKITQANKKQDKTI